ncbi:MAG: DEAD/DEAH box helicase family protein [bacterium]
MNKLYLQNIADDFSFDNLPLKWQGFDFSKFSQDKHLFDFQKQGLQSALKTLYLFYNIDIKNYEVYKNYKKSFFNLFKFNGFMENFAYDLNKKQDGKTAKFLLEYDNDYPSVDNKISFEYFINRMSFWMATGSGKTLVIVKLIELLGYLINNGEIPKNDILFLAHRDDLLEQFKKHVKEFNSFNSGVNINLKNLKDYDSVKRENSLPFFKNEMTIFYYRSDLLSDERKDKIINFKDYDNNGKWYILLDEAHKGDKEDSKRQVIYSIVSRNGFLFNFSATFTDPRDYATCVFDFNLAKFVEEGYGKHIYVSGSEITAFKNKDDFSKIDKQKIVFKTLILLTYINKYFEKVRKINQTIYHKPMLLTLVNSVNTQDSDLELFFAEIKKIAKGDIDNSLLLQAKTELAVEFENNPQYMFENMSVVIDKDIINQIEYKDILQNVLNSKTSGNIEVLKIPGNKQELIFKLQTSEKPFALIKIGDISSWLKEKLEGYEIIESFENESYFKTINHEDSDINILMGSRSFYEGWDSNRPNILLFINIGIGSDAKKFVLQSVGRGVRIEPQKNKRRRMLNLLNDKKTDGDLFNKVKQDILPLESLFVYGTNAENLKEIINTLKKEKQEKDFCDDAFIVNELAEKYTLLIPVYKESNKILAEEDEPIKYPINKNDFELTSLYFKYLGEKISLVKYECEPKVLEMVKNSINDSEKTYNFDEPRKISDPELLSKRILNYFNLKTTNLDTFKELNDEIVHFKKIKFYGDDDKYNEIIEKIRNVKNYKNKDTEIEKIKSKFNDDKNINEFTINIQKIEKYYKKKVDFEIDNQKINIKYLANHYYIPVIISEKDKIDYINHIIDVKSEIEFIKKFEDYLQKKDNIFTQFDWWMFSKLDETLDKVYIPYYNEKENTISKFKPDFIFWMQKENKYIVLFIDPKGTTVADYQHKVDGYEKIFGNKIYSYNTYNIFTKLFLYTDSIAKSGEGYRKYWFDNFDDFAYKINNEILNNKI